MSAHNTTREHAQTQTQKTQNTFGIHTRCGITQLKRALQVCVCVYYQMKFDIPQIGQMSQHNRPLSMVERAYSFFFFDGTYKSCRCVQVHMHTVSEALLHPILDTFNPCCMPALLNSAGALCFQICLVNESVGIYVHTRASSTVWFSFIRNIGRIQTHRSTSRAQSGCLVCLLTIYILIACAVCFIQACL